jgi:hypothetical protein
MRNKKTKLCKFEKFDNFLAFFYLITERKYFKQILFIILKIKFKLNIKNKLRVLIICIKSYLCLYILREFLLITH